MAITGKTQGYCLKCTRIWAILAKFAIILTLIVILGAQTQTPCNNRTVSVKKIQTIRQITIHVAATGKSPNCKNHYMTSYTQVKWEAPPAWLPPLRFVCPWFWAMGVPAYNSILFWSFDFLLNIQHVCQREATNKIGQPMKISVSISSRRCQPMNCFLAVPCQYYGQPLIGIDWQWSLLLHIGINSWNLIFIDRHWSALGIDPACPEIHILVNWPDVNLEVSSIHEGEATLVTWLCWLLVCLMLMLDVEA